MLVGAGVGALSSAVTGGNPFKGALLGGATGGLTSGASSLLSGGSFLNGALGTAGQNVAKGAINQGLSTGAGSSIAGTGIPISAINASPNVLSNGLSSGLNTNMSNAGIMLNQAAPSASLTDFGISPSVAGSSNYGMADLSFNPTASGYGFGSVDNLRQYANMSPDQLSMLQKQDPSFYEKYKSYITPQNVIGVTNLMTQEQPRQQLPVAPSGGIQRGNFQAPQGQLLNVELVPRRRLPNSLLG